MRNVMLDIETLGGKPGSVILSIGAVAFDASGIWKKFYRRINLADSLLKGFTISEETVAWWREQSPEAQHNAFFCPGEMPVRNALEDFARFVDNDKDTPLWAKGPDFDCVLLRAAYDKVGLKAPWSYRNTRDVRTVMALSQIEPVANQLKHDALLDAHAQALDVIAAVTKLGVILE